MLASILKAVAVIWVGLSTFVCYTMVRAASLTDQSDAFEESYWKDR